MFLFTCSKYMFRCHRVGARRDITSAFVLFVRVMTLRHTVMCHNRVEVLVKYVFKRSHMVSEREQMDNVGCGVCDVVDNVCNA